MHKYTEYKNAYACPIKVTLQSKFQQREPFIKQSMTVYRLIQHNLI